MIELTNVTFGYGGGAAKAISNLCLSLPTGQKVLVAGQNGAGKTTLSKILSGLIPRVEKGVFAGECSIDGQATTTYTQKALAGRVAVLFQDFEAQMVATSVVEELLFYPLNLGVPYDVALANAKRLATRFGVLFLLGRDISELSGGEKQKIEIVSLLNASPEVLILDEPFTDIDPVSQEFIVELLRAGEFCGTLIVFEQSLDYHEAFDRIVILDAGAVVLDGGREICSEVELLRRCGLDAPILQRLCASAAAGAQPRGQRPVSVDDAAQCIRGTNVFDDEAYRSLLVETENSSPCVFETQHLSFCYPGKSECSLTDVNFSIRQGDFLSVVGANGSGKTTLMKILAGVYAFETGEVLYDGKSLHEHSSLGQVGYVYQNPDNQIFAATVFDEVAFALRMKGVPEPEVAARVDAILHVFGLAARRAADPFSLPKGDRQKVACASVLIFEPDVIILDEPTTGLDAHALAALMKIMVELNAAHRTIIVITHCMAVATRYGNKIMAMNNGNVLYSGGKRQFFGDTALLRRANAARTELMELSLSLNGKLLLCEEEFAACWQDRRPAAMVTNLTRADG